MTSTIRAVVRPSRAVPITLVCAGLAFSQWRMNADGLGVLHVVLMCGVFAIVGPASWRVAFARPASTSLVAYALVGVVVVGLLGIALPQAIGMRASLLTDREGLPVTLVLFWVGGWGLGRDIALEQSLDAERDKSAALSVAAEHAQLLALKSQLDPHFLFNTLNAIAEWCREDPEVAEASTLRLATMLRMVLEGSTRERWPLGRDVELATALWGLHRARDPERFSFRVDVHRIEGITVPPLIVLPLAENAMTHGVWQNHRGEVSLEVDVGDHVELRMENPGPFRGERDGGSGLTSVRRRMFLTWGDAATLDVTTIEGARTRATLRFPREVTA